MNKMADRQLLREKRFHDTRFEEPSARAQQVEKFYSITGEIYDGLHNYLAQSSEGARVLECGCGLGQNIFALAEDSSEALGIDVSEIALNQAVERRAPGHTQPQFSLMDVQTLGLASDSFDLAYGTGILHHTRIDDIMEELRRILAPSGSAVFIEPLGHNPLLNAYRFFTPNIRSSDEHPLLMSDLALLSHYFEKVRLDFYYLTSLAAVPFRTFPGGGLLLRCLKSLDRHLLEIPLLKRYAWMVFIQLSAPYGS
jgi:SAM-dependent methyltransferase